MKRFFLLLALTVASLSYVATAQTVAVKSNLLTDALLNVNLGAEVGVAPKWTVELTGDFNAWKLSHGRRWKHWLAQPEVRYWFCDRFGGHFVGAHALGGQYNVGGFNGQLNYLGTDFRKLKDFRYQGWFVGAGIAYGYDWVLGKHWNLEAEIGIGYVYTRFDQFRCVGCGKKIAEDKPHHYFGPTKAAINLVYLF